MHTLTLFPQLLSFGFFAPLFLRVIAGLYLIYLGKERISKKYKWSSALYFLSGLAVVLGLYTQVAVLVGISMFKFDFYFEHWINRKNTPVTPEMYFTYFMAVFILLSLIVTGPGAFAFDLPL